MVPATLSKVQRKELLKTLNERFQENLHEMERTGGEPDVIGADKEKGEYVFCDCSLESPEGRRSVCYDREGQQKREKEGLRLTGNVLDMADEMGIEPLPKSNTESYRSWEVLIRRHGAGKKHLPKSPD